MCVKDPDQMKNDTDLKFGTHIPLDHIEKVTLRADIHEKRPCHVDFPNISSITLYYVYILF